MVLKKRTLLLALTGLIAAGCLGTSPPPRLPTPTPIAVLVHLERADGESAPVPRAVVSELEAALSARNLLPRRLDGVDFGAQRTTRARMEQLAATTDAPWLLLVEARVRFFSQLTGRYRWEVEVRTSVAPRERLGESQASDLSVAAFLQYEHEAEPEALVFVRRQIVTDAAELVDRALVAGTR